MQLVQSVMWNPDGKVLLAGFNGTTSLAALHFAGRPPSLGEGDLAYYAYVGSLFELDGKTVTSNDQLCLAQCLLFLTSINVAAPFFYLVTYFAVGDRCTFVAIGLARPRGHYWRVCCLHLCLRSMLLEPSLCNTNSALVADAKFELRN